MRLILLMLLGNLLSCVHNLPDDPACIEINPTKGWCTYTISPNEYYLEGKEWSDTKKNALIVPIDSWKNIKIFILEVCKDYGKCTEALPKVNQIDSIMPSYQP